MLKIYLMAIFLSLPVLSFADLPRDADRGLDVNLAGFLYAQGIYKTRSGSFVLLDQDAERKYELNAFEPVSFPFSTSNNQLIDNWIRSTKTKISFVELLNQ